MPKKSLYYRSIWFIVLFFPIFKQVSGQEIKPISIENFKKYTKSISVTNKQPIRDSKTAYNFLEKFHRFSDKDYEIYPVLNRYLRKINDSNSDYAIIFLQHQMDLTRFYGDITKRDLLKKEYGKKCENYNKLRLDLNLNNVNTAYKVALDSIDEADDIDSYEKLMEVKETLDLAASLLNQKKELEGLKLEHENKLKKIEKDYQNTFPSLVEKDKIDYFILHKKKKGWDNYLNNVKNILVVILGGNKDIANLTIDINNNPGAFQVSLSDVLKLAEESGITSNPSDQSLPLDGTKSDCLPNSPESSTIKLKVIELSTDSIVPPSEITLKHDSIENIKLEIHERVFFQIKLGASGAIVERKQITMEGDEVTISVDEDKQEELKSNLMFILDIYPWGRDLDRLEPIWKKNKKIPALSLDRLGLSAGVKFATDPLERLYLGASYAITKGFNFNAGLIYYSQPKDISFEYTGTSPVDLEYLFNNSEREYSPKFFFGISLSPSAIGKLFGGN